MFPTLLVNILWMLFMLFMAIIFFANAGSYQAELDRIDIPDAE